MKHPKRSRESRDLCAQLHDDDGLDAHRANRSRGRSRDSFDAADRRLCKAAMHAVSHLFLQLIRDPVLSSLRPHSVALRRGRFVVVLAPACPLSEEEHRLAHAAAAAARGPMRSAIAHALNRKRVPEVVVDVAPCPLESGEDEGGRRLSDG